MRAPDRGLFRRVRARSVVRPYLDLGLNFTYGGLEFTYVFGSPSVVKMSQLAVICVA